MKKFRNFKCESSNEIYEQRVNDDKLTITCKCGSKANRTLSAPKYFGNSTGRSPAAM
jgi:predicted nucleic acid-binding Zn ribbon protein